LCVKYLRGYALVETAALAVLGAVVSVPIALLCIALSQKSAILTLDEDLRREMADARKMREEMYQQSLTRFLESCIEEEGDIPVWKSGDRQ